uniref:Uncharacterized protein n=1 Tax=Trichinella nativa TaxID=6335 RepID=A0A0V1KIE4_9BILA
MNLMDELLSKLLSISRDGSLMSTVYPGMVP